MNYGPSQPPGFGYGPAGGYGFPPPEHPRAQTALILGIVGLAVCGVCAIPAFVIGRNAVREIDASGGRLGGRSMANAGRIMGIIGMIMFGVMVFAVILILIVQIALISLTEPPRP